VKTQQLASLKKRLLHPAKMTVAATLALLAARVVCLPEIYWAPIAALIVLQSGYNATVGIGFAIAKAFAVEGARVIITLSSIEEPIHQQLHS
jgi:uncharacterized membrane protein YgaE (UPF0421/DUF939 family)